MKIGTINLNGEVLFSGVNKLRIMPDIKKELKEKINERVIEGLSKLLEQEYDIIACQEFTFIKKYYNAIKQKVEENDYYIYPTTWQKGHFKSIFIIKKALEDKVSDLEILNFKKINRYMCTKINCKDNKELILINMHIDEGEHNKVINQIRKLSPNENIILLGDFNSYSDNQVENQEDIYRSKTSTFINEIKKIKGVGSYIECGEDKDYTYCISETWRKLDHILISKGLNKLKEENDIVTDIVTKVNFFKDKKNGFTDHCMLSITINDF